MVVIKIIGCRFFTVYRKTAQAVICTGRIKKPLSQRGSAFLLGVVLSNISVCLFVCSFVRLFGKRNRKRKLSSDTCFFLAVSMIIEKIGKSNGGFLFFLSKKSITASYNKETVILFCCLYLFHMLFRIFLFVSCKMRKEKNDENQKAGGGRKLFPLMHYHIAKNIVAADFPIVALSAVLPDLCVNMGLERATGHTAGEDFYRWTVNHCQEGKDVALAFATHGVCPQGLDYYSDEAWPGGERGFCFQCGSLYLPQVVAACAIPEKWGLWKGHNLVEMAFEADIAAQAPFLCDQMVAAAADKAAVGFVAALFSRFIGIPSYKVVAAIEKIPVIFGIQQGSPWQLAEKYNTQLQLRHQITTASVEAIAQLIQQIRDEQRVAMADFNSRVFPLIAGNLQQMVKKYEIEPA